MASRHFCISTVLGIIYLAAFNAVNSEQLHGYNVNHAMVSVSGISSGAIMATQYHVIHSREIMGAGIIAGAPFACAGTLGLGATVPCMKTPSLISVSTLELITSTGALFGNCDATYHMRHDKVYIFAGTADTVVNPGAGRKVEAYYDHYMSNSNIKTVFNMNAAHSMPTMNYGGPCATLNKQNNYLNNCGYDAAYDLLNHFYGNLKKPTTTTTAHGQLLKFDTGEFYHMSLPIAYSMDSIGYIYVPTKCRSKSHECKLHVAFHGCSMGRTAIGEDYVKHAGYNEVGELNDIIILYPQIVATPENLFGCWDWYGYTGALFATNKGFQITAIHRMIERVITKDFVIG